MRLLVLNYEYPPLGGGAGNATFHFCREWGKQGHDVDVVTTWFDGFEEMGRDSDRVTVYRVKSRRAKKDRSGPVEMLSYAAKGTAQATALCGTIGYDRTISFFAIPSGIIAYRLFRTHKIPYTILLRGGDVPGFLPKQLAFFHWLTMPLTRRIWRSAERVIANGGGLGKLALATGRRFGVNVDVVPNGVDTDFFVPPALRAPGPFRFLFAGRFSQQKNLPYLLDQFEKGPAKRGAKLDLVGDGPERAALQRIVSSSPILSSAVTIHSWCSKEALRILYQSAHCFVNPSLYEGLPNTVLEAMACGLPVVASDVGGNNELVLRGKNGYVFSLLENGALGKCMEAMLSAKNIGEVGALSRELARRGFSWGMSAERILHATSES
jgi:glycosyltransferase involved in cell wall biosynthesis